MVNKKWKMFERVVAAIHLAEQKGATVRWNETIKGRQFDVTVRFKNGLYEYLTVVECKDYATPAPAISRNPFTQIDPKDRSSQLSLLP